MALLMCLRGWRSYQPMYASEATFTIQVVSGTGSDIAGSYGYYDKATAEQLGKTFPYLIQSDLMRGKLCRAHGRYDAQRNDHGADRVGHEPLHHPRDEPERAGRQGDPRQGDRALSGRGGLCHRQHVDEPADPAAGGDGAV